MIGGYQRTGWLKNLNQRFWSKVDQNGPTVRPELGPCWIWRSKCFPDGYGQFKIAGHYVRAHRVAWELTNGPIPEGLYVLHICDNPPCCNPTHLYVGTPADNVRDMIEKGREGFRQLDNRQRGDLWRSTHMEGRQRGAAHAEAKLTEAAVRYIRRNEHEFTQKELGKIFGVGQATISKVVQRKTWTHI